MKNLVLAVLLLLTGVSGVDAQATMGVQKQVQIAIFAPLYLDSAFDGGYYKYGKGFPKYALPGLEFVHGAQVALDSLALEGVSIKAYIFDSKAENNTITWLIANKQLDSMHIIIGAVKDAEIIQLANFAKNKNIPFISATAPNDGGVTSNPFFVMVNATLKAHCEAIHSYLLVNNGDDNICLVRKKGVQEDKIADYFKKINLPDGKPLLNIAYVSADTSYAAVANMLDSTKNNIIIGGSLNDEFAIGLVKTLLPLKATYPIQLIGMPNWYTMHELKKTTVKDVDILYTSAYYNAKVDRYSKKIQQLFTKKFKGTATDMSFKGFEAIFLFAKLINKYPDDFISHLNEITKQAFGEYNFKPVYAKKDNPLPDYFENKHVYFMKLINGKSVRVWDK